MNESVNKRWNEERSKQHMLQQRFESITRDYFVCSDDNDEFDDASMISQQQKQQQPYDILSEPLSDIDVNTMLMTFHCTKSFHNPFRFNLKTFFFEI